MGIGAPAQVLEWGMRTNALFPESGRRSAHALDGKDLVFKTLSQEEGAAELENIRQAAVRMGHGSGKGGGLARPGACKVQWVATKSRERAIEKAVR